ncbi:MAG: adenosylcobinamide amidohydrolase [Cytophagales bacterium]|nr:adenosylcobinamide amidohydrolase [Cytophagales bacterium]
MDEKTRLLDTPLGDEVHRYAESIVVIFKGRRNVVSTSVFNGGYREDLRFAYNNSCGRDKEQDCHKMKAATLEGHYRVIAEELRLDTDRSTGMGTAALIENMATVSKSHGPIAVSAMITAGVDVNGGRAGDPASYDELQKKSLLRTEISGTINMFLHINARMPEGTLVRALMTATEAKTAALQELMANSCYSNGLATGSGTDSAIIIGNLDSDVYVRNAGKHCILGELIGVTVKEATKEALDRQSGMNTIRQARASYQAKRFGITRENIAMYHKHMFADSKLDVNGFGEAFTKVDSNPELVAGFAAYIHLVDQYNWGLLDKRVVHDTCGSQLGMLRKKLNLPSFRQHGKDSHKDMPERTFQEVMIGPLIKTMAELIEKN